MTLTLYHAVTSTPDLSGRVRLPAEIRPCVSINPVDCREIVDRGAKAAVWTAPGKWPATPCPIHLDCEYWYTADMQRLVQQCRVMRPGWPLWIYFVPMASRNDTLRHWGYVADDLPWVDDRRRAVFLANTSSTDREFYRDLAGQDGTGGALCPELYMHHELISPGNCLMQAVRTTAWCMGMAMGCEVVPNFKIRESPNGTEPGYILNDECVSALIEGMVLGGARRAVLWDRIETGVAAEVLNERAARLAQLVSRPRVPVSALAAVAAAWRA